MNKYNFICKLLMIILFIGGCVSIHHEENNFLKYRVIKKDSIFYTTPTFIQSINNDIYTLNYSDSSYQAVYHLSTKKGFNNRVVYKPKDTQQLFFVDRKNYTLGKDIFTIYKFIKNKDISDGETTIFWSPPYGIVLERANTWRNIVKLIATSEKNQGDTIAILCDFIINDVDFYRNKEPKSTIRFITPTVEKDQ